MDDIRKDAEDLHWVSDAVYGLSFSSCGKQELPFVAAHGLLMLQSAGSSRLLSLQRQTSLVAERRL